MYHLTADLIICVTCLKEINSKAALKIYENSLHRHIFEIIAMTEIEHEAIFIMFQTAEEKGFR